MDHGVPRCLLITVTGSFRAHVLRARLRSEGIDATVGPGASAGRLMLGELVEVDVSVPVHQLDDARTVLLIDEVEAAMGPPSEWWNAGVEAAPRRWRAWVASVLLASAVLGPVAATVRAL